MDPSFVYGELNADGSLKTKGAVNYPFGYGLSYTTFEQKIVNFSDGGDKISVEVEVSNKGARDGKEVVQLYYTAPYTQFDKDLHIEKATKNLVAFDKVEVKAGEKKNVKLVIINRDFMIIKIKYSPLIDNYSQHNINYNLPKINYNQRKIN